MSRPTSVCVVGSGTKFVSGITYYTFFLAEALAKRRPTSVILMRSLIPRRLYPGRDRVGGDITGISAERSVPTFDGVDWWGVPSVVKAVRFLRRVRPTFLVLQWWTAAVLPWYLILAVAGRKVGTRIVLEFHEDIDSGEARVPLWGPIMAVLQRVLLRRCSGFVVHSAFDRDRLSARFELEVERIAVIAHGPFPLAVPSATDVLVAAKLPATKTLLFFGTIRPYKGLEVLVQAFEQLVAGDNSQDWRLRIVGETWENWHLPLELVERSPYRQKIDLVNRYITDAEVPAHFAAADVVVLPYLRSSASGPLHLTMSSGLPVVVSDVGGLRYTAGQYAGAVLVAPGDPFALASGIQAASRLEGPFTDPFSWDVSAERLLTFLDGLSD